MLNSGHAVFANGAKLSEQVKSEGIFSFDEDSNIRLVEESVTYNVKSYSEHGSKSDVIVNYQLKNLTDENKNIRMFFIISPLSEEQVEKSYDPPNFHIRDLLKVSVNGKEITENCSYKNQADLPDNWIAIINNKLVDPISKKEKLISEKAEEYYKKARGVEIPFSLGEYELINLEIQYISSSGYDASYYNSVLGYVYYLTPAKFWTGDTKVNLCVNLPQEGSYEFYSNIPMEKVSKNTYKTTMDKLPDYEWSFSFFKKSGISFGTNNNKLHTIYTFILTLIIFNLMLLLSIKLKKRWIKEVMRPLAYIVSFAFFNYNINVSYSWSILYALYLLVTAIIIPLIYIIRSMNRLVKFIREQRAVTAKNNSLK